ncbi:MAG: hypothetical protein A2W26_01845 [Acidobacteria bacterium RBG_16_64_8]|nr:MAG: hypothetical protein A2W26_01845 [Acidobacteria bacterium RBG_16_64_8]
MKQVQEAPELAALDRKLDLLTAQVQYLTEQARAVSRRQEERAELVQDVVPIVNDAFRITTEQLEEVQDYVDLSDLLRLLKRLLRNARNAEAMLDQLESMQDLAQTTGPLADSVVAKAADLLESAENKGYFAFTRGSARIVDNVVTHFGEEDLRLLGDNVVLILSVLKDMTQPQILDFLRSIISEGEAEVSRPVDASVRSLLRQMRDPDVRRGLALFMRLLRVVGARAVEGSKYDGRSITVGG